MHTAQEARLAGMDSLRGLAVILMIGQHAGFWLWDMDGSGAFIGDLFASHPFLVGFNALGGLAAPLFLLLAGAGAQLFLSAGGGRARTVVKRGVLVILFGYALNLAAIDWLTAGSWYVLHCIGTCLVLSPLLFRLRMGPLLGAAAAVLLAAPFAQDALGTPLFIGDEYMTNWRVPWGPLRLALVEGHFPLLPWLFHFMTGMACARWIASGRPVKLAVCAGAMAAAGALLTFMGLLAVPESAPLCVKRVFFLSPLFYPAMPPLMLFLGAAATVLLLVFITADKAFSLSVSNVLVCLGRASFTLLLVHIAALSLLVRPLGLFQSVGACVTGAVTAAMLLAAAIFARFWREAGYRYGAEWLVRKIAG